jgi:hypothetical protein
MSPVQERLTEVLHGKISDEALVVVTLNTWKGDGAYSARLRLMVEEVGQLDPDILLLQECFAAPELGHDTAAALAGAMGFQSANWPGRKKIAFARALKPLARLDWPCCPVIRSVGGGPWDCRVTPGTENAPLCSPKSTIRRVAFWRSPCTLRICTMHKRSVAFSLKPFWRNWQMCRRQRL